MYLLYLDESGSANAPDVNHFVLAGICMFERQPHWIEQKLNDIVRQFTSGDIHGVELHGSPMKGGKGFWRQIEKTRRLQGIKDALRVGIGENRDVQVFAAIVQRGHSGGRDAVELAFEEISRRFDLHLAAMHRQQKTQRGVMIFDKCNTENRIQKLARDFKYSGHARGITRNYAEVPLFLDSQASRLIQLADLVAYSIFQAYEFGDHQFFDVFRHRIHASQGVQHGLFEAVAPAPVLEQAAANDGG